MFIIIIILCCILGYLVEIIMTFTEEELLAWTVIKLKNYLTTRGVTVNGGGGRKADLLQLPNLPSMEAKEKEITDRRLVKLKVDGITIPFPEDIEPG